MFFFVFLCFSLFRQYPGSGSFRERFWGLQCIFSFVAAPRSGRYLRSNRGIRLQALLRLAHVPTRSLAFVARFAPVPTRLFVGLYSLLAAAILEGPRGQSSTLKPRISSTPALARDGARKPSVPTLPSRVHPQDDARSRQLPRTN